MLIDSNIVIYSVLPEHAFLDAWLDRADTSFSVITQIKVLGFSQLTDAQRERFAELFGVAATLPLDDAVTRACIRLRCVRRMKLGDAIIAATALVHNLPLVTRNLEDFVDIPGLQVIDPFAA
jgi:predicted nucleic acid-binding protein